MATKKEKAAKQLDVETVEATEQTPLETVETTANEVEATEQTPLETTANEVEATEQTPLETVETTANEVEAAEKELAALKEQVAEAKRKLAEAKKATTKSRPVRMSTFVVLICQSKAEAEAGVGEQMFKSDVHYCAEKAAIDVLAECIKCEQKNDYFYAIIKHSKADDNQDKHVETLWIDAETNQIVIE